MNKISVLFILIIFSFSLMFAEISNVFSTIELGLEAGSEVVENKFHDYWDKGVSINSFAVVPYHYGSFELGIQYSEYKAKEGIAKDLEDISISLGWGKSIPIVNKIEWYNSVSFTNHMMKIIYTNITTSESEISLNVNSQMKYHFYKSFRLIVGIKSSTMFTFHKIDHTYYYVGVSCLINTPTFIKRFLQW